MSKAITFYASKFKLHWKALDNETYRNHISNELSRHNNESHWIEESIMQLCVLKKLIQCGCSIKDIKLKGPKFKASPSTLTLLKISIEKYQLLEI